jgi:HD-GYP domain-containing protein (c-di-GMP phosphodiesterase class II)
MKDYILGVPLIAKDMTGVIIVRKRQGLPKFDLIDQKILMTLAEESVMGIRNLQLYEEQQKIVLGSIKSLVTLLNSRMPQEYTHSPYFNQLVRGVARRLRLNEEQIRSIEYAGMLHDTGKIEIPLEILTKTTKLTPHEFKIIKRHPIKAAQTLRHLKILKPAIPIIMHHHERYDGRGYPSRLKKGQIPIGARIMAVVDAFEAMVYGRPYRDRLNISSALKEIKKKSGTQFDPKVVEVFLKVVRAIRIKKYLKLINR